MPEPATPELLAEEPLAAHTSLRIGGPAQWLRVATSSSSLRDGLLWGRRQGLPWRVLGPGTNCLVGDRGLRGLVVIAAGGDVAWEGDLVWVDAGVRLARLARLAAGRGLSGLEWAEGIPGSLGGAVVQNAGAYGGEIADALTEVEVLELATGEVQLWPAQLCHFGYRSSALRRPGQQPGHALLRARLLLSEGEPDAIRGRMRELQARRRQAQPKTPRSVGSTFKNPPPPYPSAGAMIEQAGLKGLRLGQAQISQQHANFFINLGGATASEVRALIERAQAEVSARSGVLLEPEVEFVGDF